jgi:hypothetical protein
MRTKVTAGIHKRSKNERETRHAIWPFSQIEIRDDALIVQCLGQREILQKGNIERIIHIRHLFTEIRIFGTIGESRIQVYLSAFRARPILAQLSNYGYPPIEKMKWWGNPTLKNN